MTRKDSKNQLHWMFSTATDGQWEPYLSHEGADECQQIKVGDLREKLNRFLTEILVSEHLVVLAGLGTTLCLNTSDNQKLAPGMKDLWDAVKSKDEDEFDKLRTKVGYEGGDNIELLLSKCQLFQAFSSDKQIETFIQDAESLIVDKCRFVNDSIKLEMHEMFLRRVARRSTRLPRTKLFTTNYDLCFENAASRAHFIVVDGFSHTQPQEFDGSYFAYDLVRREQDREAPDYIANVFHLYKMHGSVDWELVDSQIVRTPKPERPLIIYPRHSKFEASYDPPFIEMMSRFQFSLREPNTGLLVIGCGFNDAHIWQPLMSAIRSNVNLKALIVDPSLPTMEKEPVSQIKDLIRRGDSRLCLLSDGFEYLVPILPDLGSTTEDEQHRQRFRPGEHRP